jgi:uncharacterized protein (TIGR02246 family)
VIARTAALLLVAACAHARFDHRPSPEVETAARAVLDRYVSAWNARDAAGLVALFSTRPDTVSIHGMADTTGWQRGTIEAGYRGLFARCPELHLEPEEIHVVQGKSRVIVSTTSHATCGATEARGTIALVLRWDAGGWKIWGDLDHLEWSSP